MLLVVNNLCRPDIGQSRVIEQLVGYLEEADEPFTVLRARSSTLWAQLKLVLHIAACCVTRKVNRIYYTPSRAPKSILRDLAVYLACGLDGRRLIVHWHGRDVDIYQSSHLWYIRVCKRILGSAKHIGIAGRQAEMLRTIWPDASIQVVPNVVETDFLRKLEKQWLSMDQSRRQSEKKQIVMIGNLMLTKGVDVFCHLARAMADEALDFHLYGPFGCDAAADSEEVASLVKQHAPFLQYHGPVYGGDKAAVLLRSDVFLFPSRYPSEAQPLVVLEALAAGCYVIASDVGYLNEQQASRLELVEPDGAGMEEAFAEAIRRAPLRDSGSPLPVDGLPQKNYREQMLVAVLSQAGNAIS